MTTRGELGNRTTPAGFASGDRHGWLEELCGHLGTAIWAAAAADLLADRTGWPVRGAVLALPCWRWAEPLADVGRKAREADGGTLLLPVRVSWEPSAVTLVPQGRPVQATWHAAGLGLDDVGNTVLACTRNPGSRVDTGTCLPERVTAHAMSPTAMAHELAIIAAAGRRARWDLLQLLERFTRAAVIKAHSRVSNEVAGPAGTGSRPTVLDETDLEVVVDTLLLGEDGGRSSPVNRMLDRCLRPDTFRRVDPLRYIVVTLRRDTEQEIRRRIGDPRIGPKIRALHRRHPGITLPDLVIRYRELYPQDRLSHGRAVAALDTRIRVRVPVQDPDRGWRSDLTG